MRMERMVTFSLMCWRKDDEESAGEEARADVAYVAQTVILNVVRT